MTDKSMLAAVHAAAHEPASAPAAAIPSQTMEKPMTQQTPAPAAPATITSVAALQAAYPDLCKEMTTAAGATARAEGATAERDRIAGIEKLAKDMPGHDALIGTLKADGKTTPEQAAMQLIAADGEVRRNQLKGVTSVEDKTGKVAAAPATPGTAPEADKTEKVTTRDGWAAEYEAQTDAGAQIRRDFSSKETYVAFKANEHKVRFLGARKSA